MIKGLSLLLLVFPYHARAITTDADGNHIGISVKDVVNPNITIIQGMVKERLYKEFPAEEIWRLLAGDAVHPGTIQDCVDKIVVLTCAPLLDQAIAAGVQIEMDEVKEVVYYMNANQMQDMNFVDVITEFRLGDEEEEQEEEFQDAIEPTKIHSHNKEDLVQQVFDRVFADLQNEKVFINFQKRFKDRTEQMAKAAVAFALSSRLGKVPSLKALGWVLSCQRRGVIDDEDYEYVQKFLKFYYTVKQDEDLHQYSLWDLQIAFEVQDADILRDDEDVTAMDFLLLCRRHNILPIEAKNEMFEELYQDKHGGRIFSDVQNLESITHFSQSDIWDARSMPDEKRNLSYWFRKEDRPAISDALKFNREQETAGGFARLLHLKVNQHYPRTMWEHQKLSLVCQILNIEYGFTVLTEDTWKLGVRLLSKHSLKQLKRIHKNYFENRSLVNNSDFVTRWNYGHDTVEMVRQQFAQTHDLNLPYTDRRVHAVLKAKKFNVKIACATLRAEMPEYSHL